MSDFNSDQTTYSSPTSSSPAIFSDTAHLPSSPPSSPPGFPWEREHHTPPPAHHAITPLIPPQNNAFSILGKRKALSSISANPQPHPKKPALTHSTNAIKPVQQTQISLGQTVQKCCPQCHMSYILSSAEDRRLHEKYHRSYTLGYELHPSFVSKTSSANLFHPKCVKRSAGARTGDTIIRVTVGDRLPRQMRAREVLAVVERDLGAAPVFAEEETGMSGSGGGKEVVAYMYVRQRRCVGFLLTQRVEKARVVVRSCAGGDMEEVARAKAVSSLDALRARRKAAADDLEMAMKQPLKLSDGQVEARLGVSRIWTSPAFRTQGVAGALLDAALEAERRCAEIGKEDVAFSHPTEAGARLARKWFRRVHGWKVYVE